MMKKLRSLICVPLILAVCAALCSCASQGAASKPEEASAFTYISEFRELFRDSRSYMTIRGFEDGVLYYSMDEIVGDNTPEGVIPEYEGEYGIYETFLYTFGADGTHARVGSYKSIDAPSNVGHKSKYSCGSCMEGICFTQDGFVTVESTYAFWSEADGSETDDEQNEQERFEQIYYIRSFDREGRELSCAPIQMPEENWLDLRSIQLDARGNVLVPSNDALRAIGLDGRDAYVIETGADAERLLRLPDGRIAVVTSKNGKHLSLLDTQAARLSESIPISFEMETAVTGNGDYDICFTNGDYYYGYRMGDKEPARLFNLTAVNVSSSDFSPIEFSPEGVVTGVVLHYNGITETMDADLVTIRRVSEDAVANKQVIRLAALGLDYNLQEMVIAFNRSNDHYRIEISDYSVYGSNQDGTSGGETVLKTELLSGNVPDILCLSGLNYRQLANMGVLEDLYPYIDADPELSRSDFFPNVLTALEVDGKLFSTVSGFYIQSVIGAASVVGEEPGWTYEEFNAALASMPEGCTAFDQYTTRDDILSACLALDMADYIDWDTGSVRFDCPEFISLLVFANSFPTEDDWTNYDFSQSDDTGARLSQGKQMLVQTGSYGLEDVLFNDYSQYLGGRITYIGYPTTHGSGNMFSFEEEPAYAMSSSSPYKEVVWQFLRTFMSKSFQSKKIFSLPSRVDVFDDKAADAATVTYQKNSEGKYILDANGEKIPVARYIIWDSETNRPEEIYSVSREQIGKIRQLILTTEKIGNYDLGILNIVEEQAAPFFAGQKSAEEVAKLVQSKANIYVNEQR